MQALAAGAVTIVTKPTIGLKQYLQDASEDLANAVKAAAKSNVRRLVPMNNSPKLTADAILPPPAHAMAQTTDMVVAVGTSTGGTQALEAVLTRLPRVTPGIVIVQHMPEKFTEAFANRLDGLMPDRSARSQEWRPRDAGTCADRAGWTAYAAQTQWRAVSR
jgi:two-component system chemotaxis response regulator CheB